MPTYTTHYNLAKPLVNDPVDQNVWGGYLNGDMDTIDSTMYSISQSIFDSVGGAYTTVASGTTTNIGASATANVSISGTTTITAFDTVDAGTTRDGVFEGILILTHNASSLILPSGANITTAAGDTFRAVSLGSGNWRVTDYYRKSGQALVAPAITGGSDRQTFNSSGTWTKPTGYAASCMVLIECWGAGAGGGGTFGGGGGSYKARWLPLSSLGATETVTIGAGGTGASGITGGTNGGSTSFGSWVTAYGGCGGKSSTGGCGGGFTATPTSGTRINDTGGQGSGNDGTNNQASGYETGGGGGANNAPAAGSVYGGGGGGGGGGGATAGGTSQYGGNGGTGTNTAAGGAGTQPGGGGGGGSNSGAIGGAGAAGRIVVTVIA